MKPLALLRLLPLLLLLPLPLRAQTIPGAGAPAALDIATWNLKWFGDPDQLPEDTRQFRNVLAAMRAADVDLWALQEVANADAYRALVDSLGAPYEGVLATVSGQQRLAFLYDSTVVRPTLIQHLFAETTEDRNQFAGRPPLLLRADVTLPDTTVSVSFIVVHLKAFGDQESYEKRQVASSRLKTRLDFLYPNEPIVILGDFNDELGASTYQGQPSPYTNFLADPEDYRFLTLPLDEANEATYCATGDCTAGSTLDHILISDELFGAYAEGSARRYTDVLALDPLFVSRTTDHLPVVARFSYATGTAAPPEEPVIATHVEVYPNPFRNHIEVKFTAECSTPARIEAFDLLGRQVAHIETKETPGTHTVHIPANGWPAGVYAVRVSACGKASAQTVVRLP